MKRRPAARCLMLACAATIISSASAQQLPKAPGQRPPVPPLPAGSQLLRDLAYVPDGHERQKLDLYLPAGGKKLPLIVWVHGGGWEGGTKDNCAAIGLLWRGYALASINYRLSPHAPYPAQIEDCKAAIRWLRANATKFNLDADRIGAWGASAGGHLVALLGTTGDVKEFNKGPNLEFSSRVQAVCDFFGPTDLMLYGTSQPGDTLSRLIGGPIQDNKDKVAKANPSAFVTRSSAPFLICHGDMDNIVPLQHSQSLAAALKKAGVEATLVVVPGAGHGFGGNDVNQRVGAFFEKHLGPAR